MKRSGAAWFLFPAWVCYVISFFLPVLGGMGLGGSSSMNGAQCALFCGQVLIDPPTDTNFVGWAYYGFFTIANLLMVVSPLLWVYSLRKQKPMTWLRITTIALVFYVLSVDLIYRGDQDSFYSGYFLWVSSFMLLAAGVDVNARQIKGAATALRVGIA